MHGLRISGGNIFWRGGTLTAEDGLRGKGFRGYALHISGSKVTISGVLFTDARLGAVVLGASQVRFENNRFSGLRADGMNLIRSSGIAVVGNVFEKSRPDPAICRRRDGSVVPGVPKRDCDGTWQDGDHPDAVQMRNGVSDVVLERNIVTGNTQGLTQMDTTGDAPLSNVRIVDNRITTENYHTITLGDCRDCRIERNQVRRGKGSQRKAVIHAGSATRCGNSAQDEKTRDKPCR